MIRSVEELIDSAIAHLPAPPAAPASEAKNLYELFAPVRGLLTDEEVDTLFRRNQSSARPVNFD